MSSSIFDLPEVGWRVLWIIESELKSTNPPHNWSLTILLLPRSKKFPSPDGWEEEYVKDLPDEVSWSHDEKWKPEEKELNGINNVVNPEHFADWMSFFAFPVVVGGGLRERIV